VVVRWEKNPILLTLERFEGGIDSNIKFVIMDALMTFGGLTDQQIIEHLVCLGIDGVSTFQRVRFGIIDLLKTHAPYLIGIHCMAHRTNLAMQSLFPCQWFPNWKIYSNRFMGIFLTPLTTS